MTAIPFMVVCGRRYSREEWEAETADLVVPPPAARAAEVVRGGQGSDETRDAVDRMRAGLASAHVPAQRAREIAVKAANRHDRTK